MNKRDFVRRFQDILGDHGDMFFSSGDIKQDYYSITGRIEEQGYWAGDRLRYYFDGAFNLIRTEERKFG